MTTFMEWFQNTTDLSASVQAELLTTLLALFILWMIRWITNRLIDFRIKNKRLRYWWSKTTAYVTGVFGVIAISFIWLDNVQSVATFLGLLSAGLAISLKDPVANVMGWLFIVSLRPFEVGDRIELDNTAGDVIDIRLFQFTLLEIGNWVKADQSTGRVVHIPNGKIFVNSLSNYSKGFEYIWNEIPVTITFESNWEKAKIILNEIADIRASHLQYRAEERVEQVSQQFMIVYPTLTPIVYTKVVENGILLTIRYLTSPRQRRASENNIWEDILKAFSERADIEFAYPTQRFYNRPSKDIQVKNNSHSAKRAVN